MPFTVTLRVGFTPAVVETLTASEVPFWKPSVARFRFSANGVTVLKVSMPVNVTVPPLVKAKFPLPTPVSVSTVPASPVRISVSPGSVVGAPAVIDNCVPSDCGITLNVSAWLPPVIWTT